MIDTDRDLTLQRVIRAPRERIWTAWTSAAQLQQWWTPAPALTRVDQLDVQPGGGFVTWMSEDGGEYVPHTDGIFLVVEPFHRLVFTNAVDSQWHPAAPAPVAMTAEIVLREHPEGTDYQAIVRHGDPDQRRRHEQLGFFDGWGAVTAALAAVAESGTR
ncbi:MAG TPA: SRPBCC domain-containing protein [Candidatus Ruania gallistercoris]|uniref:SRPBCC domain-containing protein n=1 Tax=Candidatus Ruania gallistercoris TaxID=2838746 RepID=A0A9D2EAZ1_9MICO|nr:SRPBCC domain-containing protein [Candidatus Ruania gallistercoris]